MLGRKEILIYKTSEELPSGTQSQTNITFPLEKLSWLCWHMKLSIESVTGCVVLYGDDYILCIPHCIWFYYVFLLSRLSLKQKKEPQPFQVVNLCRQPVGISVCIFLVHQQYAKLLGKVVADIDDSHYTPSLIERKTNKQIERNVISIKPKKYTKKYCTIFSLWPIIDTDFLPMQDCYLSQINKIHAICNKIHAICWGKPTSTGGNWEHDNPLNKQICIMAISFISYKLSKEKAISRWFKTIITPSLALVWKESKESKESKLHLCKRGLMYN